MSEFVWLIPDASLVSPVVSDSPFSGKIDHVAQGLARLPQQWRNKQNLIDLLTIFLQRWNDLEDVFWDLLTLRNVYTAVGAQMDVLGKIVGQPRNGLGDDDYRRYLFARIATNNSDGVGETLIKIARLIVNDNDLIVDAEVQSGAAWIIRLFGMIIDSNLAGIVIAFLRQAKRGGVKLTLESSMDEPENMFVTEMMATQTGSSAIGDTKVFLADVSSLVHWPTDGSATIDSGGNAETITFTTDSTPPSFLRLTTALTKNHSAGVEIHLLNQVGKGFGDSSDTGQPTLTPYSNVGTTGGRLADARE